MSIYSEMTNSRNPGRMVFMEGDDDYWLWVEGSRGTPGTLQQWIVDEGGRASMGISLNLSSFSSDEPDVIGIQWPGGLSGRQSITMRMDSETSGTGGIYEITQP